MWFLAFYLVSATAAYQSRPANHHHFDKLYDACPSNSFPSLECHLQELLDQDSSHAHWSNNGTQSLHEAATQLSPDFPWSYWPECYANENTSEPICVFTDQKFANGRGISLVTTSSNAYNTLDLQAFTDPSSIHGLDNYDSPPYIEVDMPGRGRGLTANKTIRRGDVIFASTPILLMNPIAYDLIEEERLKLSQKAVQHLPKHMNSEFWKLMGHSGTDAVDDRINTNAFEVYINGLKHHAVFPEIAKMNHDCRPNAQYHFSPSSLTQYVLATTTIPQGTEITITYINYHHPRTSRLSQLHEYWGFNCSCSACTAHPSLTTESDSRLAEIDELEAKLGDFGEDSQASPEMAVYLLGLLEMERLYASVSKGYYWAAVAYSAVGDRWNARRYARKAVEGVMIDSGFEGEDVRDMRELGREPERHWSWRRRVRAEK